MFVKVITFSFAVPKDIYTGIQIIDKTPFYG